MFEIWANLALLIGLVVVTGAVYFVVYVLGKILFEDMVGGTIKKVKRKMNKDDQYIY